MMEAGGWSPKTRGVALPPRLSNEPHCPQVTGRHASPRVLTTRAEPGLLALFCGWENPDWQEIKRDS